MAWCKVLSESRRDSGPNLRSCRFHSNMWVPAVCLLCTPWESLCPTRVLQLACIKGCWGFQLPWQVALIDNSGNAWLQLGEQIRFLAPVVRRRQHTIIVQLWTNHAINSRRDPFLYSMSRVSRNTPVLLVRYNPVSASERLCSEHSMCMRPSRDPFRILILTHT